MITLNMIYYCSVKNRFKQQPITCLDGLTNTEYQPGDEWTQTRIFDNGPTTGMQGQFRFVNFSVLDFEKSLFEMNLNHFQG